MYGRLYDLLDWIRDNIETITIAVVGVFVFGLIMVLAMNAHNEWVVWCEEQGGRVISDTDTHVGTGIGSDGNSVVTTSSETDYYCLNENGGIIDIR